MSKIRQHIDTCVEDQKYVENFEVQLDMLVGLVEEMLVTDKQYLLSPVMRKVLSDKGRKVKALFGPMKGRLHVDNPCDPLKPWVET